MKRTLFNFVSILCLLTFFLSSAACLAVALPAQVQTNVSATIEGHSIDHADHECCPGHASHGSHMSDACCAVHHQPSAPASTTEAQQASLPSLASHHIPSLNGVTTYACADPSPVPLQQPSLIALRI